MRKRWKTAALGFVLALAAIQVVSCERTNPPVKADLRVADDVKAVLRRACYDCHSNETTWPWYSRVAPVSWLLHWDATEGRAALNFSDWESLPPERRAKLQRESGEEIQEGGMPPWYYIPLHPNAKLSAADKKLLQTWVTSATSPSADAGERLRER